MSNGIFCSQVDGKAVLNFTFLNNIVEGSAFVLKWVFSRMSDTSLSLMFFLFKKEKLWFNSGYVTFYF